MGKLFLKGTIHLKDLSAAECMEILAEKIKASPQFGWREMVQHLMQHGSGLGASIQGLRSHRWKTALREAPFTGRIFKPDRIRLRRSKPWFIATWYQDLECTVSEGAAGCKIDYRAKFRVFAPVFSFIWLGIFLIMCGLLIPVFLNLAMQIDIFPYVVIAVPVIYIFACSSMIFSGLREGKRSAAIARDKLKEWLADYDIEDIEE